MFKTLTNWFSRSKKKRRVTHPRQDSPLTDSMGNVIIASAILDEHEHTANSEYNPTTQPRDEVSPTVDVTSSSYSSPYSSSSSYSSSGSSDSSYSSSSSDSF